MMRWSGSLEGYLDLVTDQLSLSWEYRDGVVVIERFRTEFFEIAALELRYFWWLFLIIGGGVWLLVMIGRKEK